MTLTARLALGTCAVITVLAATFSFVADRQARSGTQAVATEALVGDARLVGALWADAPDAPSRVAARAGTALGRRVTMLDTQGVTVGTSGAEGAVSTVRRNLRSRPEVAAAMDTGLGVARRLNSESRDDEIHVAIRVESLGIVRVSTSLQVARASAQALRRQLLLVFVVALLIAVAVAVGFSQSVARPVRELSEVAQAIAGGDLGRRPTLTTRGELGDLTAAVRALAEQLSARLRAIETDETLLVQLTESRNEGVIAVDARRSVVRINETARRLLGIRAPLPFPADLLPRDVVLHDALQDALAGTGTEGAELVRLGRSLTVAAHPMAGGGAVLAVVDQTRVRRLESLRRDFVANASHELRTPLTIIGGFAETLVAEDAPFEVRRGFAERILGNTRRMQRIVDDLLDLSRIESGGWVPNPRHIDLGAVTDEVIAAAHDAAAAKGLAVSRSIPAEASTVFADATALRQVLANLVDNAVRHTPQGSVTVFSEPDASGIVVGVRDTGVGIAANHLPRIFERFYRVDAGRAREEGGTGLGLAIVKHLVEAHGGWVKAESEVGVGTTIAALFPHAQA